MATYNKFNQLAADLANGLHNLATGQLVVALTAAADAPVASNSQLSNLTQIAYTNLSSRNITTTSSTQTSGTYSLVLQDLTLTASGGSVATFRYVAIYNDSSADDKLICWFDLGENVTLADGASIQLQFQDTQLFTLA